MGRIMIINGSPRAPKSNSKKYAEIFAAHSSIPTEYFAITKNNHLQLCETMENFSYVVLDFPLYADGIPVTLLNFLKTWEEHPIQKKPTVSVMINCGFLEPEQNDIAVEMIRLFCKKNQYDFGAVLKIGSGEAILETPFKSLVENKIKKFSYLVGQKEKKILKVTMPLPKRLFIWASTRYWTDYGKKNGLSSRQMATMDIEKE